MALRSSENSVTRDVWGLNSEGQPAFTDMMEEWISKRPCVPRKDLACLAPFDPVCSRTGPFWALTERKPVSQLELFFLYPYPKEARTTHDDIGYVKNVKKFHPNLRPLSISARVHPNSTLPEVVFDSEQGAIHCWQQFPLYLRK